MASVKTLHYGEQYLLTIGCIFTRHLRSGRSYLQR